MSMTSDCVWPRSAGPKHSLFTRPQPLLWLALAALLLAPSLARAEDPDDQYLNIYGLIQEADSLNASGKGEAAQAKYRQAQAGLERLHKRYPTWNTKLISFRMDYVNQKLAAMSEKSAASTGTTSATPVKLLDAGAEPRTGLRLHPKPGDKQTLLMTIKMSMTMKIGAAENPPVPIPAMKLTMEMTVKGVSPEGEIAYDIGVSNATMTDDASVPPQVASAFKAAMESVKGTSGTVVISDRGLKKDTQLNLAGGADPQAGQMVEQIKQAFTSIIMPLPEEAVGPGARWEARIPDKSQGFTIDQTQTYQLETIQGDRLTARSTVTQRAANQKVENPAMPGLKLDLTQMTGRGSGTVTVDLGQVVPREAKVDYHSELTMAVNTAGQKQTIGTKIDMQLQLESK